MIENFHAEDIKASIRKKYKTLNAFERVHGLPHKSVSAWLRGNVSAPVKAAIEAHLRAVIAPIRQPDLSLPTSKRRRAHRINEKAA